MSTPEIVTVSIDGREAQVPKGTGLVETALAAGVEIPVFCYEPRLGPPIGACRMCLVEVEGMPKLQAGCTLTAQDGMVVRTAQTSPAAADGQSSTLEFILVNHPLDCPVCDKGGECPLQDLTFRWGPPVTRNTFPKRTFEKPIPISPTIALDRERCILCYRCTRFSSDVAEDSQLVARDRGSQSVIATFEDEPYRAPFSGNVIELCPVGALTSTQYRFEARPWEIQDVPTVCGLCPVGCNIASTTREGKVKRIISRNHPEVDEGWLCDKGRFGFAHLRAERPRRRPAAPVGPAALRRALLGRRPGRGRGDAAGSGPEHRHRALRLRDDRAGLRARQAPARGDRGALRGHAGGREPGARRLPPAALGDPGRGADRRPRRRPGRRAGTDRRPLAARGRRERAPTSSRLRSARRTAASAAARDGELASRLRESERAILIWSGPGGRGGATVAGLAAELGFGEKPGCGAFQLLETANGRGVADAWAAAADGEDADPEPIELLIVSGDEAAANPDVRALAERASKVLAISMFRSPLAGWADLVLPGTSYLERDGTYMNLEGRLQRLRRAVIPPCPDELAWIAKLAERFGVTRLAPPASGLRRDLRALLRRPRLHRRSASGRRCPSGLPSVEVAAASAAGQADGPRAKACASSRTGRSSPARPWNACPELQFQRPAPEIELSAEDAAKLGVEPGASVSVRSNGTSVELRARVNKMLAAGVARVAAEHAQDLGTHVEVGA